MSLENFLKRSNNSLEVAKFALSVGISFVLILFSGIVVTDMLDSISEAYEKQDIVELEEKKVDAMRFENLSKQQELEYVISEEYVEREARENFNYLKGEEKIFLLPETALLSQNEGLVLGAGYSEKEDALNEWIELLFR